MFAVKHSYCAFLFVIACALVLATGEEVAVADSKAVIDMTEFGDGILRLQLKPVKDWVYEVEEIVVRSPVARETHTACEAAMCSAKSGSCVLQAKIDAGTLQASYKCNDKELVKVAAAVGDLNAPNVTLSFTAAQRLYGVPEHAMDLALKPNTTYEMYNNDAFEYEIDSPKALYGSIPFMMGHSASFSTGVLFLNSAGMKVTVLEGDIPSCQWTAEVGLVDLFFFPGPTPSAVQRQHASITGTAHLPPYFSLGFHQCRWNYRNTEDALGVDQGFDQNNLPYDVLWLDIEHTDEKKYFTWDKHNFPEPSLLINALSSKGRKLVTVKDPHVKKEEGYFVYDEAVKGGYLIKTQDGGNFEAKCWPGKSVWVDFYNKNARDWYATLFRHDRHEGGSHDVHTWVDMNEPSVFETSDKTISRDVVHTRVSGQTVENRYLHNMYSILSIMAVFQGHLESSKGQTKVMRPFILARSFFAGSQRYGAMWTGDNMARWNHLQNSIPELLSLSVSNFPFCGADIGGFFREPESELFVRWLQAGVFYPFMRAHAHLETKRREPWLFGEEATDRIRVALALRYSLLPYLYTQFYHSHFFGETVLRPLFYEFPHEESLYDEQYTFMFGPSILASPVLEQGVTQKNLTIPAEGVWYSYKTGEMMPHGKHTIDVDMDSIPMFLRGGHIIPTKLRARRGSFGARNDPFTLYVVLNEQGNSAGDLFIDDGESYDYKSGIFMHRQFTYTGDQLFSKPYPDTHSTHFEAPNTIERIIIFGYKGRPKRIVVSMGTENINAGKELEHELLGGTLLLRKPDLPIANDWTISLER